MEFFLFLNSVEHFFQKPNLILNVDGCIAVCFVDLMRQCGCFTKEESQEFIDIGALNAIFVLGRRLVLKLWSSSFSIIPYFDIIFVEQVYLTLGNFESNSMGAPLDMLFIRTFESIVIGCPVSTVD